MDELGIDRAIMWPTLASLVEERLRDDPRATHVVVHALNEWMYEHWTFDYEDRIFATPVITLPIVDRAIEELEWVLERGARVILIRPAPVPGFEGPRSFALAEFDPFWERSSRPGILVGMHASPTAATSDTSTSGRASRRRVLAVHGRSGFAAIVPRSATGRSTTPWRRRSATASAPASRPQDRSRSRTAAHWVRPLLERLRPGVRVQPAALRRAPGRRASSATSSSTRSTRTTPSGLIDLIGVDHVLLRLGLPAPGRHRRPDHVRRRPRRAGRRRRRQDHGRQPRQADGPRRPRQNLNSTPPMRSLRVALWPRSTATSPPAPSDHRISALSKCGWPRISRQRVDVVVRVGHRELDRGDAARRRRCARRAASPARPAIHGPFGSSPPGWKSISRNDPPVSPGCSCQIL